MDARLRGTDLHPSGPSRREWLARLAALGSVARTKASGPDAVFHGIEVNHVALRVTDLDHSRNFYQELLGLPGIIIEKPGQAYLRAGRNFIALFERGEAGMDHFAISVEGYGADAVERKCLERGLETRRASSFVYIHDPDGLEVQIAHAEHEVHSPVVRPAPDSSPFRGIGINHIALRVRDVARSRDFYREMFGMPVVRESASSCFLGLSGNFVALFRGRTPAMDHYCFSIDEFEVRSVTAELERQGLNPRQPAGSRRVYFGDPDGITLQLAGGDHQP